jgi:hypothetical protein
MAWINQNAEYLANVSTTLLFAITALVSAFGIWQFYQSVYFNREMAAKAVYANYLALAFENPQFANPDVSVVDYDALTLNGSRIDFEKYEWFVTVMANAYEEISFLSKGTSWETEIKSNLDYHRAYFRSDHYRNSAYLENVGASLRPMIRDLMEN